MYCRRAGYRRTCRRTEEWWMEVIDSVESTTESVLRACGAPAGSIVAWHNRRRHSSFDRCSLARRRACWIPSSVPAAAGTWCHNLRWMRRLETWSSERLRLFFAEPPRVSNYAYKKMIQRLVRVHDLPILSNFFYHQSFCQLHNISISCFTHRHQDRIFKSLIRPWLQLVVLAIKVWVLALLPSRYGALVYSSLTTPGLLIHAYMSSFYCLHRVLLLPRDAMRKRGTCCRPVSARLSGKM